MPVAFGHSVGLPGWMGNGFRVVRFPDQAGCNLERIDAGMKSGICEAQ